MVKKRFMLIAGETSGDQLAASLVSCLREESAEAYPGTGGDAQPLNASLDPEFFGAGGPEMAAAGVELEFDMTRQAVVGLWEVMTQLRSFRRLMRRLFDLSFNQQPHAIICVDFSGFNLRLARAIKRRSRSMEGTFGNWRPLIVQYVSPQVWASRPGRARWLEQNCDLLLSIFPFEREWYAKQAPRVRVEFVGHPIVDRYGAAPLPTDEGCSRGLDGPKTLLILPGSRPGELKRHLPVMKQAVEMIRSKRHGVRARMVLPDDRLIREASAVGLPSGLEVRCGGLDDELRRADVAIASTGTVTLECAWFKVPTVAIYKTSWATYQVARQIIKVKHLAMPNLLAGEEVFPEFIQDAATPDNIARATIELLDDKARREAVRLKLAGVIAALGPPGASKRAATAILELVEKRPISILAGLRAG
jgi:lipid-A-disaccharide synthase